MSGPLITASALEARLGDPNTRIVDCRFDLSDPEAGRRQWLNGHIPAAVFADLDRDLAGRVTAESGRHPLPPAGWLAKRLGELGIGNDTRVVVYDAGAGALAARAWWLLRWLGHEDVSLLERGLAGWTADDRDIERGEVEVSTRSFTPRLRDGVTVTTEEVEKRFGREGDSVLVDARERGRFLGEYEPIDRVAGHIPGAMNLPYGDLIEADGRFLSLESIRQRFADVLGEGDTREWAVMCGSGVTACHLALAAAVVGRREPALYVGSWSEWIRDPNRPVATGK